MDQPLPDLTTVAREFGLRLIVRFGSTATHRARPDSDQDIAVLARPRLTLARAARLVGRLEQALGPPEVDLTLLNDADPLLLYEVARDGVPLYEAEPAAFVAYRSYAARRFDDADKFRRATRAWLERRLA